MDAAASQERRTIARNPGNTIEPVRLRLGTSELIAKVQDISVAGIGVLVQQNVEPGTWLVLEPAKGRRLSPELRAEVRHTTKCEDDYLVGCRFARYLTMDDVMALG